MTKINLYEITQELDALNQLFEMEQGEVTDELQDLEEYISKTLVHKADNLVDYVRSRKDRISLAKERINQLRELIRIEENGLERLDGYVANCMTRLDKKKIEGFISSITLRKPSKRVEIIDELALPAELITIKQEKVIDKRELLKMLKEFPVEGAKLVESKKPSIIYK